MQVLRVIWPIKHACQDEIRSEEVDEDNRRKAKREWYIVDRMEDNRQGECYYDRLNNCPAHDTIWRTREVYFQEAIREDGGTEDMHEEREDRPKDPCHEDTTVENPRIHSSSVQVENILGESKPKCNEKCEDEPRLAWGYTRERARDEGEMLAHLLRVANEEVVEDDWSDRPECHPTYRDGILDIMTRESWVPYDYRHACQYERKSRE